MPRKSKSLFFIILTAIIISLALVACGGQSAQKVKKDEKPEEAPVIVRLEGGDWGLPSPFSHYPRGPGMYKMRLIYDSLIEKGEDGLIPWLAKDWEISDDGKEYIFDLHKDVKWHDGENMTAEDVVFSFEYFLKHPPVSDSLLIDGKPFIKDIEAVNDVTVKITVDEANATVLDRVGIVRIIPKHIWEDIEDPKKMTDIEKLVGCGPFILKEYNKEHGMYRFEAFEDYWGPRILVDAIEFVPVSDEILAFDKGEIDLVDVPTHLLDRYKNSDEFKISKSPAFWGYKLLLNMDKLPELRDIKVRQALAHSIDYEELVEKVARGAAVPASPGYLPIDHILYNGDVKRYDFDIEKAKQLLDGKNLSLKLLIADSNKEARIAELLKINFAKAGVDLKVESTDMKTRDSKVKSEDYELVLIGHGGWGRDADLLRDVYATEVKDMGSISKNTIPGYNNDKINELCEKQMREMDEKKRKEIIYDLQQIIAREIPIIPLYNTIDYTVYRPKKYDGWVHVFDHHSMTHNKLSYLEH